MKTAFELTVSELMDEYGPTSILMNAISMVLDEISEKENLSDNEMYLLRSWQEFHQRGGN
jgi:hypothetical protein